MLRQVNHTRIKENRVFPGHSHKKAEAVRERREDFFLASALFYKASIEKEGQKSCQRSLGSCIQKISMSIAARSIIP